MVVACASPFGTGPRGSAAAAAATDRRRLGVAPAVAPATAAAATAAAAAAAATVGDLDGARGAGRLVVAVSGVAHGHGDRARDLVDAPDGARGRTGRARRGGAALGRPSRAQRHDDGLATSGAPLLVSAEDRVTDEPFVAVVAPV